MELWRLRYFVAVAEELHFGRAAARLHISQPSLSQQIRALEEELGAELLRRNRRSVALTPAGDKLLQDGRRLLHQTERTAREVGSIARGEVGHLTVGFVGPAMEGVLPAALRRFREKHPLAQFALWHRSTEEQLRALHSGEQDIGLLRPYRHDLSGLVTTIVETQCYVLALPAKHPLASKRRVSLRMFGSIPLILFPRAMHPALFDRMLGACAEANYQPEILHEASTKAAALSLVAADLGIALVPEGSVETGRNDVAIRHITDALPDIDIVAARSSSSTSVLAESFLEDLGG